MPAKIYYHQEDGSFRIGNERTVLCHPSEKPGSDLHEIAEALSENSTLNPVDCYGVMVGMAAQIAKHLQEGNVVNIEFLGTFRIRAKSTAVESPELVTEKTIGKPSVNFRPSVLMKQRISKTQFVPKK
ncbi:HU family DNA-binding protein [Chryseobacterium salivictor]|uniref:HU domain-containing protein n=1 Tax=Chryseobacterium salivictor TaxID=2547600 RepID=A0A4V1AL44_9FLAO|nr:HU family DNA-binding protein [Chryseobacterium salivictor]QBO58474.1 hypothetical protein NBC122_01659 [Chryseobacterium salivictor]